MAEDVLRVLLVEDDEEDYLLTRGFLRRVESQSFDLVWASRLADGLDRLRDRVAANAAYRQALLYNPADYDAREILRELEKRLSIELDAGLLRIIGDHPQHADQKTVIPEQHWTPTRLAINLLLVFVVGGISAPGALSYPTFANFSVARSLVQLAVSALVAPLIPALSTALYYQLKGRADGFPSTAEAPPQPYI